VYILLYISTPHIYTAHMRTHTHARTPGLEPI